MKYSTETTEKTWAQVRVDDRIKAADGAIWHIVKRAPNADGPIAMSRVNADGSIDSAQTVGSPPPANAVVVFTREDDVAPTTEAEAVTNVVKEFPATETASGAKAADVLAKVKAEGTQTAPVEPKSEQLAAEQLAADHAEAELADATRPGRAASKCCDECGRHALAIGVLTARVARLEAVIRANATHSLNEIDVDL